MYEMDDILSFPKTHKVISTIILYCIYNTILVVYRVFFHPLAKYPGSKLAAGSTEWYAESVFGRDALESPPESN